MSRPRARSLAHLLSVIPLLLAGCSPGQLHSPIPFGLYAKPAAIGGSTAEPPSGEEAHRALEQARSLRRVGERDAAVAVLRPLLGHPNPAIAAEAEYATALLRLELGYPAEAAGALEDLLQRRHRR